MRAQRKSKLLDGIKNGVISGKLKEPFTVEDVNKYCNGLLQKSPAFLGKHCEGNPGNYTVFFERISKGSYKLK